MENADYSIILDVTDMSAPVSLNVKQGDAGRVIAVNLARDGVPVGIEPGSYAVFAGKKPDEKILWNSCSIRDSTIFYEITKQTTAVVGWVPVQIRLYRPGGKLVSSPDFVLIVDGTVTDDEEVVIVSENEVTALTELVSEAADAIEHALNVEGKSAYQVAQEAGFEGTVEEWLDSLVGPKGGKGDPGPQGVPGKDGGSTTITLKYGVSSTPSMNTVTGWQDTIPQMSETYPYLWIEISTETITATGGSSTIEAGIIGYYSTPDSGGNANQGTGWTTEQIELLDQLFNYIPFTASEGGTIADNLIASLRGEAVKTLVSISAVYSGGEVVAGTALTALTGIIVTATYDDGSTATVYGYTLSGTIAEGENTITVTYGGKTATFTVTGTASSGGEEEPDTTTYTVTNNLTNVTTSNAASTVKHGGSYSATLSAADGYTLDGANVTVTIGGVDFTSSVYMNGEINIATVSGDILITATAVADITSVVVEMVANNLTRDQVTIYSDEGVTVDEGTYSGSIRNAVVSSMAFSADTQVRVTRKRASEGSTWTTVLIGESDPSDLTKIYNAVVHDNKFVDETIERPHDYTVHAGRKLVVRYYNHLSSGVLVTSSVAPDVPDVPDTPVGSEVAMTYAGSNSHADNGNANAISNFTVYTDEGTTAITYPVEGIDEYLNGRYISDEAFELDTDVTIARSVATDAAWTTIVIGECDADDESVVYNAVLSDHGFTTPSTEKTYSYTVHAGRKLVMFRRNNNINAYTLTVTK